MIKKLTSLVLVALMVIGVSTTAFADTVVIDRSPELDCKGSDIINEHLMPVGEPIYEHLLPTVLRANIRVNVTSPCDQIFRSDYPTTYAYEANNAIENADEYLLNNFGIDYRSVAQPLWTSPTSNDAATVLADAISDHGLTYNGSLTADIMVAFSGKTANNGVVGRVNQIGDNYAIVFDRNYNANSYNVQHETGHLYQLRHHDDTNAGLNFPANPVCVMNQGLNMSNFDNLCTPHKNQWDTNKNYH